MNLHKIIEDIRIRTGMYLGTPSITKLYSFWGGYEFALYDLGVKEIAQNTLLPLPIWFFHEYVAHRFGYCGSTAGWCNMILDQTGKDEEKGLQLFYVLLDEFKQLGINRCFAADLNSSNIAHHVSDKYAPRRMTGEHFDIEEPLYQNPVKVLYAELTNDAGHKSYTGVIYTSTESIIERRLFKTEKDILAYFRSCFGEIAWEQQIQKNIQLTENADPSERNSCYTSFMITGTFDPDDITKILELQPEKHWKIGDLRGDGTKYDFALWEYGRCSIYDTYIENQMMKTLENLFSKVDKLIEIKRIYQPTFTLHVVPSIYAGEISPCLAPNSDVIKFCYETDTVMDIDLYVFNPGTLLK